MFEAHLPDSQVFRKIFEAAKELLEEASFDCSSDGMSMQAMDAVHVSLVSVELRSDGFQLFRCDRAMNMGFKLNSLIKILKCAGSKDSLKIIAEDNGDKCTFQFESPDKEKVSQFDFKLIDLDSEHLSVPHQEHSVTVKMPSSEYARICRDLSSFGDTVTISCTKGGIMFSSNGDIGKATIRLQEKSNADDEEGSDRVSIEVDEPLTLSFAAKYLNHFAKAGSLNESVCIMLTASTPMVVEYKIGDYGHIRFFLAPKVDEDDDDDMDDAVQTQIKDECSEEI